LPTLCSPRKTSLNFFSWMQMDDGNFFFSDVDFEAGEHDPSFEEVRSNPLPRRA
jgi:hypothetical protein